MHIKNFDPYDFSKKVVEGIPVYYKNLPWSPCTHIHLVFSVGAFNDPKNKEGLAHFLEHMIGAGSPMLPNKKAVKEFNRLYMLNSRNAYTSYNITSYTGKCLPENFGEVVTKLLDQVKNPFIREEDVERERKIITQESWGVYKNQKFINYIKEFTQNLYRNHEKSRIYSPLGWPESIEGISQNDLKKFHFENYVKENFSIFIVGSIQNHDLNILSKLVKTMPKGKKAIKNEGQAKKPLKNRIEKTSDEIGDPKKQLEFSICRFMPRLKEKDEYTAYELSGLLYDILFERLRTEHSLCYGVRVPFRNFKSFSETGISVQTSSENLNLVEKEVWKVIDEIKSNAWKDRFEILNKLTIDQIKSNERSTYDITYNASKDFVLTNKIESLKKILDGHKKVTYNDIKKLTKKIFDKQYILTEIIFPSEK